jgi:hypothetical protein
MGIVRGAPAPRTAELNSNMKSNDTPPVAPVCPDDNACCQSGCDPCVFDLYAQELAHYRAALHDWEARQAEASTSTPS